MADKVPICTRTQEPEPETFRPLGDPSYRALVIRYRARRDELLDALRLALAADAQASDWIMLAGELHKLAGVAANFGEEQLGNAARALECMLKEAGDPRNCKAALQQAWPHATNRD
ncbi:Hpt domain-containing protein [Aurantiacibacter sp. MUD11]|uniref:Hpt domain-containing protein n=1 Tax=Aurantiacibacter sp. MUD11 TaxID=3003265 RepID=UPI0022AAB68D|nr:Hpt domain-containing protein [Aurantiacibacter sp. MUD11]WAT18250.1 Hpt domain-containing protein [Aurantiacibacter sp. MUD11]